MEQTLTIAELESRHGEDFINHAYQSILGRPADPAGRAHYLKQLCQGRLRKFDILVRLRFSPEGRCRNVVIPGFTVPAALSVLRQIPVLGWLSFMVLDILRLPFMLRPLQAETMRLALLLEQEQRKGLDANLLKRIQMIDERSLRIVNSLENAIAIFSVLNGKIDVSQAQIVEFQKKIREELRCAKQNIRDVQTLALDKLQQKMVAEINQQVQGVYSKVQAIQNAQEPHFTELDIYQSFEDRFRGSEDLITNRLHAYLPQLLEFRKALHPMPALDLGCGRGEWLRLLTDNGVRTVGVDSNADFCKRCLNWGLEVYQEDLLAFLKKQNDASFGYISAFHVVEHLPTSYLLKFLQESRRVLCPGGMLLLETPNPMNLHVGACNFYSDPSHIHPIVPQTLDFFVKHAHFAHVSLFSFDESKEQRSLLPLSECKLENLSSYGSICGDYALTARRI